MILDASLWGRLAAAGIVSGTMPKEDVVPSPWYVIAMVGVAAWLSALFLLAFVGIGLAAVLRDAGSALVVGLVICAGAVATMRVARRGLFLRQLAVASSLAGQALVVFGILDHEMRNPLAWLGIAAFEAALVLVAPDVVHRVLATLGACVALRMSLMAGGAAWPWVPLLAGALVAVHAASVRAPVREALWSPVLTGLGLAVLGIVPLSLLDALLWYDAHTALSPIALRVPMHALALAAVWLAAVAVVAREAGMPPRSRAAAAAAVGAVALALASWPVPAVVAALVLTLVAFAGGRHALVGLASLGLLGALAHTYYTLEWTLLAKAGALAATGALLLAAAALVRALPVAG
jgi:hypothetical protein